MRVQCKPSVGRFRSFRKCNAPDFVKEGKALFGSNFYEKYEVNYLWNFIKESFINICDKHAPFFQCGKG